MKNIVRKHYRYFIPGIILFILLSFTSGGSAQSTSPVTVRIVPEEARVVVGNTVEIAVEVEDVEDLYGIDILLEYNPEAVEVVDMDPDLDGIQVQLGTFLDPGFVILNLVNNEVGRLRLAMTQLAPSTPKSGTGNLIIVRFRGKALADPTDITIISAKLADPFGGLIDVGTFEDGTIEVVQTLAEPTATDLPVQQPGTPMPTNTFTTVPTQGVEPTQGGTTSEPTQTPTDRLLFVPPTSTITPTPTITQTPTITLTPTQTLTPTETLEPTPTTVRTDGGTGTTDQDEGSDLQLTESSQDQRDAAENPSIWWFIVPGGLILGGILIYLLRKKATNREESLI